LFLKTYTQNNPYLKGGERGLRVRAHAVLWDLRESLSPSTETDARVVCAQLDMVRRSMRLLHWSLPAAGAVILLLADVPKTSVTLWWVALVSVCLADEALLIRMDKRRGDVITLARARAWQIAVMGLVLGAVWSSVAWWTWQPGPEHRMNHIFSELILVMTLAVASTMLSLHAATALAPVVLISTVLLLTPALDDFRRNDALIGLLVIYVVLMLRQAGSIHTRVKRMLRLEQERTELIERLNLARRESDAARREAEEASQAKSAFLANMSHELRTPLNAIIGFSDIIRTRSLGDATEKYREYGGFVHGAGRDLLRLINDLLDIANIEAGRKTLARDEVDLGVLAEGAVAAAQEATRGKNVLISCDVARGVPAMRADAGAMRQILDNLISNAVKFSPEPARIEVSVRAGATQVLLSVRDNGVGIAPGEQMRIFDRFGRGEPSVAKSYRGIGLGLKLVKALVEMHGGSITLQSRLGHGTTMTVGFPIAQTRQTAREAVGNRQ
jgi:signal transduction histidine kinase